MESKSNKKHSSYEDLKVWQKGVKTVKELYKVTEELPDSEKFGLSNQIRRAVISIPVNVAEGWGRNSTKSYVYFLTVAKGSVSEVETLLKLSIELNYLHVNKVETSFSLLEEVSKMLYALINRLKNHPHPR